MAINVNGSLAHGSIKIEESTMMPIDMNRTTIPCLTMIGKSAGAACLSIDGCLTVLYITHIL